MNKAFNKLTVIEKIHWFGEYSTFFLYPNIEKSELQNTWIICYYKGSTLNITMTDKGKDRAIQLVKKLSRKKKTICVGINFNSMPIRGTYKYICAEHNKIHQN